MQASTTGVGYTVVSRGATKMQGTFDARQMLEFSKSLDIDPILESEMIWIAEEAAAAPLPLGWGRYEDKLGRVYFHNLATGESVWQHPLFGVYRKSVEYYRAVVHEGGFWNVDAQITQQEEQVRIKLADWMELFDEKSNKYYFNRRTENSRFDDPRTEMYQRLYEQIRMVTKMKEQLPVYARAQKPRETTVYEKKMQQFKEDEERRFHRSVLTVQRLARMLLARKKVRQVLQLRNQGLGPQSMRSGLRLRLESCPAGHFEVVLGETTPHKRSKMAIRIQARVRGIQGRRKARQLMAHQEYRARKFVKVQRLARRFLQRKRDQRAAKKRIEDAARMIQRVSRGMVGRKRARLFRKLHEERLHIIRCAVKIQCRCRQVAAKMELHRRRQIKFARSVLQIQSVYQVRKARMLLGSLLHLEEPIQCAFVCNGSAETKAVIPWAIRVLMAPVDVESGQLLVHPYGHVDLLVKVGPDNALNVAATIIQKIIRGVVTRLRFQRSFAMSKELALQIAEGAAEELVRRIEASITIQKVFRGWWVRHTDVLGERKMEWIDLRLLMVQKIQASMNKFVAQDSYSEMVAKFKRTWGATCIQRHWRGWLARRLVDMLATEAVWPLRGFFDYTATGPNSTHIGVRFFKNPRFDGYMYFSTFGGQEQLARSLEEMQIEVELCVEDYLGSVEQPPPSEQQEVDEDDALQEAQEVAAEPGTASASSDPTSSSPEWMQALLSAQPTESASSDPTSSSPEWMQALLPTQSNQVATSGESSESMPEPASGPAANPPATTDMPKEDAVGPSEVGVRLAIDAKDATVSAVAHSSEHLLEAAKSDVKAKASPVNEVPSIEMESSNVMDQTAIGLIPMQADPFDATARSPSGFSHRPAVTGETCEKAPAVNIDHESQEDKQAMASDLEASRQPKVEELVQRQRKHQSKNSKQKRREVAALLGDGEQLMAAERKRALGALMKQKEKEENRRRQAWKEVAMKERLQHEIVDKHEQRQAEIRDRRLRIAEKRQERNGTVWPIDAPMQFETQLLMHRHVHHHMHYHNPGSTLPAMTGKEVARGGVILGDMHRSSLARSASDMIATTAMKRQKAPVAHAMSASQLPPLSWNHRQ